MGDIKTWVMVANLAFMVIWSVFIWWHGRSKAAAGDVSELRDRVVTLEARPLPQSGLADRVLTLEQQYQHLPDSKLVQQLAVNMGVIRAELEGLRAEMRPLAKQLDRVNDFLLSNK